MFLTLEKVNWSLLIWEHCLHYPVPKRGARRNFIRVEYDIIIQLAWQIGHPFSAAKRSLGLKLGRYVDWESLAKGCYGDVRSCHRWDARPSRTKWPKSWYFGQKTWYFGRQLYHRQNSFVGKFIVVSVKPHPCPVHRTRFRSKRLTFALKCFIELGWVGASQFGHAIL